ncbi:hypothetical protein [Pseudomonas fluorescens]|uniref:hypothetical protein n=1 Tax=Pseudomonas fluorescens TaxID=294 RepID=UPI000B0FCC93|nr:hypothetical protein [Pseudomonas fluorescens]
MEHENSSWRVGYSPQHPRPPVSSHTFRRIKTRLRAKRARLGPEARKHTESGLNATQIGTKMSVRVQRVLMIAAENNIQIEGDTLKPEKTGAAKHSADYRDRKKAEADRLGIEKMYFDMPTGVRKQLATELAVHGYSQVQEL